MGSIQSEPLSQMVTTCGFLLYELQIIWDEVGESEPDRDKMLLELEQECLEVYRRRVDLANRSRAQLRQAIADSEAELAASYSAMGELPSHMRQTEQKPGSLKEELNIILSQLEEMRKMKADRKNQFVDVFEQIQKLSKEIYGSAGDDSSQEVVDDNDLTIRRLQELQKNLQFLQKEKNDRLKQVLDNLGVLSSLCSVLGLDFKETIQEIHPSLAESEESHNINTHTLQKLESATKKLRELKLQRMQRLQDLGMMLLELWNLMDTPVEEQQTYQQVTCNIASSEDEIIDPNMLSADFIKYVETEVCRLEELKSSKMKELALKKRAELEEICRKTHLVPKVDGDTEHLIEAIESGALNPASILDQMELEVAKVKEEAFSRTEVLEKVEKWLAAREEEEWLDEYNSDQNRYNTGRGSHLILKRAEKARTLVNKLPVANDVAIKGHPETTPMFYKGMVEILAAKTQAWEDERGVEFLYDEVRLLSMLEEYMILRQEKEQEKKRHREQKKLQGQQIVEQEVLFGSKSSPMKSASKKFSKIFTGGNNKKVSVEGNTVQSPRPNSSQSARATPNSRFSKRYDNIGMPQSNVTKMLDRNFSFNEHETEPAVIQRQFSSTSSAASTRGQDDSYGDENLTESNTPQYQTIPKKFSTPLRSVEENCTPKAMHNTISAQMDTSMTHAPLQQPEFQDDEDSVEGGDEDIEYSFEEIRAGCVA